MKNIVLLNAAKTSGNRKFDRDLAVRTNMKQRTIESLYDYLDSFNNTKDVFAGYCLANIGNIGDRLYLRTRSISMADIFTYYGNEFGRLGRDKFPVTLLAAISTTAKGLVSSPNGP